MPRLRSATSSPRTVRTSMATSAEASAAVRKAFEKRASAVSTIAFRSQSRPPRRPRSSVNASAASWTARDVPGGTSQEATTSPRGYPSCGLGGGRRVRIDLGGSKKEDFKIRLAPPVCRAERFFFPAGASRDDRGGARSRSRRGWRAGGEATTRAGSRRAREEARLRPRYASCSRAWGGRAERERQCQISRRASCAEISRSVSSAGRARALPHLNAPRTSARRICSSRRRCAGPA